MSYSRLLNPAFAYAADVVRGDILACEDIKLACQRFLNMVEAKDAPPAVLDLMKRVKIIPSHKMTLFGPCFTIFTKDGKSYTKQSTGREFIWDFDTHAKRIQDIANSLPIPAAQYGEIVAACRDLEKEARADKLVRLTVKR